MGRPRILVVDDKKDLVKVVKVNLEHEGYRVETAYDGEEALSKVARVKPDLIILDIMLPKIDGWEVLSQIRGEAKTSVIPVIILTAKTEEASKLLGYNLGTDDYVTKPFSIQELMARVNAVLRRFKMAEGPEEARPLTVAKIPVVSHSKGTSLIDQDQIFYAQAIHNYAYIHDYEGKHLTHFTLAQLEARLADSFMRIHRSYIVNLHQVDRVFSPTRSSYKIQLKDKEGTVLPVSRNRMKQLKGRLGL